MVMSSSEGILTRMVRMYLSFSEWTLILVSGLSRIIKNKCSSSKTNIGKPSHVCVAEVYPPFATINLHNYYIT